MSEVTCPQCRGAALPGYCPACGTDWRQTAPKFWPHREATSGERLKAQQDAQRKNASRPPEEHQPKRRR